MSKKIPWELSEYVLDEEQKIVWLRGNFMRSIALHHGDDDAVPGYEIKLVCADTLKKLKSNPNYLKEIDDP